MMSTYAYKYLVTNKSRLCMQCVFVITGIPPRKTFYIPAVFQLLPIIHLLYFTGNIT